MYDCARQRGILFQCEEEQTYEEQQRDGISKQKIKVSKYFPQITVEKIAKGKNALSLGSNIYLK